MSLFGNSTGMRTPYVEQGIQTVTTDLDTTVAPKPIYGSRLPNVPDKACPRGVLVFGSRQGSVGKMFFGSSLSGGHQRGRVCLNGLAEPSIDGRLTTDNLHLRLHRLLMDIVPYGITQQGLYDIHSGSQSVATVTSGAVTVTNNSDYPIRRGMPIYFTIPDPNKLPKRLDQGFEGDYYLTIGPKEVLGDYFNKADIFRKAEVEHGDVLEKLFDPTLVSINSVTVSSPIATLSVYKHAKEIIDLLIVIAGIMHERSSEQIQKDLHGKERLDIVNRLLNRDGVHNTLNAILRMGVGDRIWYSLAEIREGAGSTLTTILDLLVERIAPLIEIPNSFKIGTALYDAKPGEDFLIRLELGQQ